MRSIISSLFIILSALLTTISVGDSFGVNLTGNGNHRYLPVPNWITLERGMQLGSTHGDVDVGSDDTIYFTTDTKNSIMAYSPDGQLLRTLAEDFVGIHALITRVENGEEFIYAAHLQGKQAVKFTKQGGVVWTIPWPEESGKYENIGQYRPTGIAVGPDGDIYIADGYGQNWIHQYSKDREYIRSFGGKGKEPGKFNTCHAIDIDMRGEQPLLIICDREANRIQHFDLEGNFVSVSTEHLRRPTELDIWGDYVAVSELSGRVVILDKNNAPVAFLGDNPDRSQWSNNGVATEKWVDGIFTAPHGIAYDSKGNLYVQDWNKFGRVSKLLRLP